MKYSEQSPNNFLVQTQTPAERTALIDFLRAHPEVPRDLPTQGEAIPTFHCIGLYWDPPGSFAKNTGIPVRYCKTDAPGAWVDAFPLNYDPRSLDDPFTRKKEKKVRGSLVGLKPDTEYLIQFGVPTSGGPEWKAQLIARTWSESFPVERVVRVASAESLTITQGGSPGRYVRYQGPAILDTKKSCDASVIINASHVIVSGLTCRGGKKYGILLEKGVHDVVIEDCDISDWGSSRGSGVLGAYGTNLQGGIHLLSGRAAGDREHEYKRIVIQRNVIHDPAFGTNDWSEKGPPNPDNGHPEGPHAISMCNTGGNHVIRYNRCFASEADPRKANKWFNDIIGGNTNASDKGFPGPDSDVYGNDFSHGMDDGIEAEGGGRNVRIWGNRLDWCAASFIATNVVHQGPTYIWRNVALRGKKKWAPAYKTERPYFHKTGDREGFGGGRRFVFHNTVLSSPDPESSTPLGAEHAADDVSDIVNGLYARNNLYMLSKPNQGTFFIDGPDNSMDYDLSSTSSWGKMPKNQEGNGILNRKPVFLSGHGTPESKGLYQLADNSPGKNAGQRIAGFNDVFDQSAPDLGAHEGGQPPMRFGPEADDSRRELGAIPAREKAPQAPQPEEVPEESSSPSSDVNRAPGLSH